VAVRHPEVAGARGREKPQKAQKAQKGFGVGAEVCRRGPLAVSVTLTVTGGVVRDRDP
jgi:hypothetical protein